MMDLNFALRTTVLLVDDDIQQLQMRALAMKTYGLSVIAACGPTEAISIMNEGPLPKIDYAVIDYLMPVLDGCVLAEYLKARDPELKIVLYSGAIDVQAGEMTSVDAFVPESDEGLGTFLAEIATFGQVYPGNPAFPAINTGAFDEAIN